MYHERARTSEALENFIQSQKALLERTHTDIERLKELRRDVENESSITPEYLGAKLSDPTFKLSEQLDAMPSLPSAIDWSLFKGADPMPFQAMATNARETYAARNTPPKTQLTAPSDLRQFVADARRSMLDPVLNPFRLPDDLAALSSDDDEPSPEEQRRAREREKIRELKKQRIEGEAGAAAFSKLGLRKPVSGVFIRRDQEDESAEVDISMGDDDGARSTIGSEVVPIEVDTPATSAASPLSTAPSLHETKCGARERRPSRKVRDAEAAMASEYKSKAAPNAKARTKSKPEREEGVDESTAATEPPRGTKAKSETYKQAWSVSEQHLLERLLEEIPEGEKNRWLKISNAMNGRRTPRQVASRVQKYFEKLKRFGVEVGGAVAG